MKNIKNNKKKLNDILDSVDEAGLDEFLAEEIQNSNDQDKLKENGYLVSGLALAYMQTMNRINSQYKKLLAEALQEIAEIDGETAEIKDGINLAKVRSELS